MCVFNRKNTLKNQHSSVTGSYIFSFTAEGECGTERLRKGQAAIEKELAPLFPRLMLPNSAIGFLRLVEAPSIGESIRCERPVYDLSSTGMHSKYVLLLKATTISLISLKIFFFTGEWQ